MTIPLEHVDTTTPVGRNFELLARRVMDTGGQSVSVRFGSVNGTWPGGQDFHEVTVNHGLGKAIVAEYATANSAATTGALVTTTNGHSLTTLTIRITTLNGSFPALGTQTPISWLVVG